MRGLVYSVHLEGIGHLKTVLTVCQELLKYSEIDFLQGGEDVGFTIENESFNHILLEPVNPLNVSSDVFYEAMSRRKKQIYQNLDFSQSYDFFLVEQVPFAKQAFLNEVLSLIEAFKTLNPKMVVVSLPMGVLRQKREYLEPERFADFLQREARAVPIIRRYFDHILVSTDPRVFAFDETFEHARLIQDKCIYTGFIIAPIDKEKKYKRKKRVLYTAGSGKWGYFLYPLILDAAEILVDYEFVISTGPMLEENHRLELEKNVAERRLTNVKIVDFIDDLASELQQSALSISTGGSSVYLIAATHTPAIVFPLSSHLDQALIAQRFSDLGMILMMPNKNVSLEDFLKLTMSGLRMEETKPPFPIDFDGAKNIAKILKQLVTKKKAL